MVHNGSTRLHHFIRRNYYWEKLHQNCNKYLYSCTECQQVTLKETQYIDLHLPIPKFPMSFISVDLVGPYREIENKNQYALTIICMLTNYVFMIPIRSKSTEDDIKVYCTGVYSTFRAFKDILSDHSIEFTRKKLTFWQKNYVLSKFTHPLHPYRKFNHRTYTFLPKNIYQKTHMQSSHRLG